MTTKPAPSTTPDDAKPAVAPSGRNPLSPKKLLLSKWTAVHPRNREKHFVVVRVIEPEPPAVRIERIELEAVHSGRVLQLHWRELTDPRVWRQGWV
ncbi:MAG: TIGR02450 family Trp-rich protein [Betaproteobacteria bacterium]|nr:TIGR02450 family Trp-rich protein [Betaproteobacteria bacterium]